MITYEFKDDPTFAETIQDIRDLLYILVKTGSDDSATGRTLLHEFEKGRMVKWLS